MEGVVVPIDFYLEQLEGSIMRNKQKFPKSNSSIDEYIGKSILIEEAPFVHEIAYFLERLNLNVIVQGRHVFSEKSYIDLHTFGASENMSLVHFKLMKNSDRKDFAKIHFPQYSYLDDENDSSVAFPSVSLVNGQTYNIETVLEVVQYANPIIDFRYKIENVNTRIDLSIYS